MEDYEIWGYAVSKMREKRGITQGKLAEQLGYSSSHFRRIEKGQIPNPSYRMMINIGEILHMDMLGITDQVREFEEQIDKNYGKDDSANGKVKKKIEKLIINND